MNKDTLESLFLYRDGCLYWRGKPNKKLPAGTLAGSPDKDGYILITINRKKYKAHRLIYIMHHGVQPDIIDHIDRNRANNLIENLRSVSLQENAQNMGMYSNNKSGIKHIHWYKQTNCWAARIKKIHIGYFKTIDAAANALHAYKGLTQ